MYHVDGGVANESTWVSHISENVINLYAIVLLPIDDVRISKVHTVPFIHVLF